MYQNKKKDEKSKKDRKNIGLIMQIIAIIILIPLYIYDSNHTMIEWHEHHLSLVIILSMGLSLLGEYIRRGYR